MEENVILHNSAPIAPKLPSQGKKEFDRFEQLDYFKKNFSYESAV